MSATSNAVSTSVSVTPEAHARDRVVRRLLMRGKADAIGERRRHRVAVRRDEGDVPTGEPQPQRERERERGDEQDGEGECGHDGRIGRRAFG